MIIINKVILLGRLTKDPDLRFAAGSGKGVCKFSIAVTRQFNRDEADFLNCVAFGKTAETIAQYMLKGSQIALTGHIQTGSYEREGRMIYTTDVVVENMEFLEPLNNAPTKNNAKGKNVQVKKKPVTNMKGKKDLVKAPPPRTLNAKLPILKGRKKGHGVDPAVHQRACGLRKHTGSGGS